MIGGLVALAGMAVAMWLARGWIRQTVAWQASQAIAAADRQETILAQLGEILQEVAAIRAALERGFEVRRESSCEIDRRELSGLAQGIFAALPRRTTELESYFMTESRAVIVEQLHKLRDCGLVWQDASKRWRRKGSPDA